MAETESVRFGGGSAPLQTESAVAVRGLSSRACMAHCIPQSKSTSC